MAQGNASSSQSGQNSDTNDSNIIIVTARAKSESLLEIPLAVTAFSEKELERQNVLGLEDIARFTPGLQFQDVNGAFQNPSLRGLTQTDQTSAQGNVGVFLDGVYLNNRSSLEFGAIDLARIEVVKGPQSALYGRNTFGGAINYVTKDAQLGEFTAKIDGSVGTRGLGKVGLNANIPIGNVAALQVFAGLSKFDGTILNTGVGDNYLGGWSKRNAYGGKLFIEPTPGFRLTFFGMYAEQQNDAPPLNVLEPQDFLGGNLVQTPANGQVFTLYGREVPQYRDVNIFAGQGLKGETTLLYGKAEYDLPIATVSALVGYLDTSNSLQISTSNNTALLNIPGFLPGASLATAIDASTPKGTSTSVEIKIAQNDGGLDWMLGGFYFDAFDSDTLQVFFLPVGGAGDPIFFFGRDREVSTRSYAGFGSVSYEFNDKLTASAELRYTDETLTLESGRAGPEQLKFKYWTPRFILDYKITPDVMLYANVGRGVKSGGFAGQPAPGGTRSLTYGIETNWSYEVGLKGSALNNTLQYQAAAYYIKWNDVQIQTALPGSPISVVQNFGSITSKGLEFDASYFVTPNFSLRGSLAFLDPTYDDGFIDGELLPPCGEAADNNTSLIITKGCTADVSGNLLARTSKFQGSLSATYEIPNLISDYGAYIRADYSYESPRYANSLRQTSQGVISLTNLRVGFSNDRYELAFWVDNLFDQTWNRRVTVAPEQGFGGAATGVRQIRVYPGDLRTFGIDFSARF